MNDQNLDQKVDAVAKYLGLVLAPWQRDLLERALGNPARGMASVYVLGGHKGGRAAIARLVQQYQDELAKATPKPPRERVAHLYGTMHFFGGIILGTIAGLSAFPLITLLIESRITPWP